MTQLYLSKGALPLDYFRPSIDYILDVQRSDGAIPWFHGGHFDPWDHTEAAMGLSIAGHLEEAEQAYDWLRQWQLEDGSWWARYEQGQPVLDAEARKESNFTAYVATGVWHHYLITTDETFLRRMWRTVERAIDHVVALQCRRGTIPWAVDAEGIPRAQALVTGCSSVHKSLECALNIATVLGHARPQWSLARERLGDALRNHPERFDQSKTRYSMDWFYPILGGVVRGAAARQRLQTRWSSFVEHELGCRCVSDEPWVTVAESCELTLALLAAGERHKANELFSWLHQFRCENGVYWTGYQFSLDLLWPDEQPTWTAGAVLLAADALAEATPAARLFTEVNLLEAAQQPQSAGHREPFE